MNAVQYAQSNRIVELMRQPAQERDTGWVRDAVKQAILLELAALPPYLCGMLSISLDASLRSDGGTANGSRGPAAPAACRVAPTSGQLLLHAADGSP